MPSALDSYTMWLTAYITTTLSLKRIPFPLALGEQDNKLSLEHSNLRDGTVVRYLHIRQYLTSMPFNDSYLFSFLHLMPVNYSLFTASIR